MTMRWTKIAVRAVVLAAAAYSGAGMAQQSTPAANAAITQSAPATKGADSGQLEEVVVTARFTTESAQHTPIAISTVTSEQIEARGLEDVADVSASIPNVTFVPSGENFGKSITAFVRGIGQVDSSFSFNPAVGIYLDDVYIGAITGANLDLVDVASVDVLRGPQGTLFGANTESGAVVVHTIRPTGDGSGYASLSYGSYEHVKVTAGFDVSLIDNTLFLRVSGISDKQNGYQKVMDFACLYPSLSGTLPVQGSKVNGCQIGTQGGTDLSGGRVALRWLPADNLEVNLAADLINDTGEPTATSLIALNPAGLTVLNSKIVPLYGVPLDSRFIPTSPYISYDSHTDPLNGEQFRPIEPLLNYGFSGTVDWHVTDSVNVKSVSAYRRDIGSEYTSNDQAPIQTGISNQYTNRQQVSQEIDLNGKVFDNALEWAAGVFYYHANGALNGDIDLPGVVLPFPAELHFLSSEQVIDENKSAFAHAIYHFDQQLSLELGVRYTDETKSFAIEQAPVPGAFGFPLGGAPIKESTDRFDPKVSLQYQWTPDFMTYATYSTGFKGGGVNPYVVAFASEETPFGPETLKSYELGAKSEWLDRHLRVNFDVFQMNYNQLQEQVNLATAALPQEVNVGNARLRGAELELEARAGDLSVNASASYLNYKTLSCGSACVGALFPDGQPTGGTVPTNGIAPLTPKSKFNVGAQYALRTGGALGTFTPRIDYTYQSMVYFDISNNPAASQGGYGVANLRLLWSDANDKWTAQAAVTNLFAKFYWLNQYDLLDGGLSSLTGTPAAPREVLFTVKRKF
jgi:iron complex outermembrane recepter protein